MSAVVAVVFLVVYVGCIVGVRQVAVAKGREPGWWALAALLVGPVVLLVVALLPSKSSVRARSVSS